MHRDSIKETQKDTCATACRMSAENALRDKARRMHEQACAFEKLADKAAHMSGEAEEALWDLVCQSR